LALNYPYPDAQLQHFLPVAALPMKHSSTPRRPARRRIKPCRNEKLLAA
jgi:hypothetical protein